MHYASQFKVFYKKTNDFLSQWVETDPVGWDEQNRMVSKETKNDDMLSWIVYNSLSHTVFFENC